jgi:hypothetical protein
MKRLFTALLVCTMLLCIPLVSYSSDEATTIKTEYDLSYDISYDSPTTVLVTNPIVNDVGDYTYKDRSTLFKDVNDYDNYKYYALSGVPLEPDLTKRKTSSNKHYFHYIETYKSSDYSVPYRKVFLNHPKLE